MTENDVKSLLEGLFATPAAGAAEDTRAGIPTLGLEERVRRRALRLETAAEISSATTSILDLDKLLPLAVELIRERFNLYYVGIFLLDEAGANGEAQYATLQAATGRAGQQMMKKEHKLKVGGDSMIGWCVANAQARIAVDVAGARPGEEAVRFDNPYLPKTRSEMALPLLSRGRVIGAMTIQSVQPAAFDQDDIIVLQTMSDQLANAIENARLFQERERRITELAIVNEVGQAMSTALGLDALLEVVHLQVSRIFDTTNFYIATYREGSDRWTSAFHLEGGQQQTLASYSLEAGFTGYIIRSRQPLLFRTGDEILAFAKAHVTDILGDVASSWLGVPLITSDTLVGVMAIQNYEHEHLYDEQDLALFSTIATQVANAMENLRLLEETRRRAQEVEAINEIGQAIASVLDLEGLLRQVVDITKARFDHYFVSVVLLEGERLVFRQGSVIGNSDLRFEPGEAAIDLLPGPGPIAEAARTGQPVLVNDTLRDPRYLPLAELADTRAEMDVPIEVKGQLVGVLSVQHDKPFAYDETDVALTQSLANQIGIAIDNARLFQGHERRIMELAILDRIRQTISQQLGLEQMLEAIYEQVQQVMPVDAFFLALYDEQTGLITYPLVYDQGRRYEMSPLPLPPTGYLRQVIDSGKPHHLNRTSQEVAAMTLSPERAIGDVGKPSASLLYVPLISGQRTTGVISVQSYSLDAYDQQNTALLKSIADQAAIAIERARLFEETQHRTREMEAINEIGQAITSVLDLEGLLRQVVDTIKERFGHYFVGILLIEGNELVFRSGSLVGDSGSRWEYGDLRLDLDGKGLNVVAVTSGQPVLVNDVSANEYYSTVRGMELIRSELDVPIEVRGRVIGTLTVQSDQIDAFAETDVALLQSLASQAGVAIENAQLFAQAELSAQRSQALYETSRALSSQVETDPLMHTILEAVYQTLDCEHAAISIVDERAGIISAQHTIYQGKFDTFPEWLQKASYPLDHPDIIADVYRTGRTEIIGEWDERFNREIWEKYSHERFLRIFMPIQIHGRVLGVVEVGYDKEKKQSVSEDEVQLLATFMDQAASALENALLFEEVQSRADELAILNRMSRDLSATLDLESIIESIYHYTSQLMDTTSFYIAQYDPQTDQVWFPLAVEHGERAKWGSRRAGTGLTEYVIRSAEPLLVRENVAAKLAELGIEAIGTIALSWLGVPMRIGSKVVGVIAAQSYTTAGLYTEYHRDLLSAIASQAAVAAENARLFEEAQARAHREQILREITTRVRAFTDTETIMRTAVRELGTALDRPTFIRLGDAEQLARPPTATGGDNGHDTTPGGE